MKSRTHGTIQLLQQFSIPLIAGVVVALALANINFGAYETIINTPVHQMWGAFMHHGSEHAAHHHAAGWEHFLTLHFLVNEIFMVFFFGIAAKEITEACLPGGALNPPSKAINPLLATIGGVVGPVGAFFLLNSAMGEAAWTKGWGIPTATDIALAWLVARFVFGKGHPAVSFLLLLAVADDAIGLGIIAIAYPDPAHPTVWANVLWTIPAMAVAYGLRRFGVQSWLPYICLAGPLSWWGLYSAHLHPALALVFIVPFLPGPRRDLGLYVEKKNHADLEKAAQSRGKSRVHSPLENFEHDLKLFVDFGLFFFALANAGVPFSGVTGLTWIVLLSLAIGKTVGITAFSLIGEKLGFQLPTGMQTKQLVVAGLIAGIGLTVALFVSGQAFVDPGIQAAAKMGALFSGGIALLAVAVGKLVNVRDVAGQGMSWSFNWRVFLARRGNLTSAS